MSLRYAEQFTVEYAGESYKRITINNDRVYLLVAEGAAVPEGDPRRSVTVLQQPLDQIYLVAAAAMDYFDKLNAVDCITLSGKKQSDWYIQRAKDAMDSGALAYAGKYSEPDYELILSQRLRSGGGKHHDLPLPGGAGAAGAAGYPCAGGDIQLRDPTLGPDGVDQAVRSAAGQRGRGRGAVQRRRWTAWRTCWSSSPQARPWRFFYITSSGAVNVRKSTDYVAKCVAIAGGNYVSFDESAEDNAQSTINIQMESFYNGAVDADVLIYNSIIDGELHTLDELVALDPLMADFKAVKSGNVWCLTKNFYQESLELSDLILDVNHALNDAPDTAFHFLTRMK